MQLVDFGNHKQKRQKTSKKPPFSSHICQCKLQARQCHQSILTLIDPSQISVSAELELIDCWTSWLWPLHWREKSAIEKKENMGHKCFIFPWDKCSCLSRMTCKGSGWGSVWALSDCSGWQTNWHLKHFTIITNSHATRNVKTRPNQLPTNPCHKVSTVTEYLCWRVIRAVILKVHEYRIVLFLEDITYIANCSLRFNKWFGFHCNSSCAVSCVDKLV